MSGNSVGKATQQGYLKKVATYQDIQIVKLVNHQFLEKMGNQIISHNIISSNIKIISVDLEQAQNYLT